MKKVFTILIVSVLLVSGMKISIDRHYCGGNLVDIKISLNGEFASCGMEQLEDVCPSHQALNRKCCEDQITFYSLSSNYFPENFKIIHPSGNKNIITYYINNHFPRNSYIPALSLRIFPPGNNLKHCLTLPEICVFRS